MLTCPASWGGGRSGWPASRPPARRTKPRPPPRPGRTPSQPSTPPRRAPEPTTPPPAAPPGPGPPPGAPTTFRAPGRLPHAEPVPPAPRGRIPTHATLKQRMARQLRTKPGKAAYAQRKAIVEPVFGQIMTCHNGRQLLLRGEDGARGEWRILSACHNLRKIFGNVGLKGPPRLAT